MSEKEKAIELLTEFTSPTEFLGIHFSQRKVIAKHCALICCDRIIESNPTNPLTGGYIELYSDMIYESTEYWQRVKQEIQNL